MNRINVVGLGPGSRDYIPPAAFDCIRETDVIIAAQRHLSELDIAGKETVPLDHRLDLVIDYIKHHYQSRRITVAVSGDPGFYSLLAVLRKYFTTDELSVIPGISSFQYLFARLGKTWEDCRFYSLHGRGQDVTAAVKSSRNVFFLTDLQHSYRYIAEILTQQALGHKMMYVGNNLSYNDEQIISGRADKLAETDYKFKTAVTAVCDE